MGIFVILSLFIAMATAQEYCTNGTGSAVALTPCFFPFQFSGVLYDSCTDDGWNALWCSTTFDYDTDSEWGDCSSCVAENWCTNGSGDAPVYTPCVFPFVYNNTYHYNCTMDGWTTWWCSTTTYYDLDTQWGDCTSCPSNVDLGFIYGEVFNFLRTCPDYPATHTPSLECPFTAVSIDNATDLQVCSCIAYGRSLALQFGCAATDVATECTSMVTQALAYRPSLSSCVGLTGCTDISGCLYNGSTFYNGSEICINGTTYACENDTWQSWGSCANECIYDNTTYLEYDFICVNGENSQCISGSFVPIGNCTSPAFANCSQFGQLCSSAFSTTLNELLVFCGQNETISSAASLCYPDNGEYVCENNMTGQNWIIRSVDSVHHGIQCPAN
jgi:hypothetical protein